jgi:hypothetical protein
VAEEGRGDSSGSWRGIDELASLVGAYAWVEHRIFQLTGAWASAPGRDAGASTQPALRVWCAAASRHHGELAGRWAARLPVRAGVDPAALVAAPAGHLAGVLDGLAAEPDPRAAVAAVVRAVLPRLDMAYLAHLASATPVCEAPVMDVLAAAHHLLRGEIQDGRRLTQGLAGVLDRGVELAHAYERAFEETRVFPAVRPS